MNDGPTESAAPPGDGAAEAKALEVKAHLEPVIKDLPERKKEEIVHTVEQTMMAFVRGGGNPPIDPETAKVLAATIERDNENKFKFLTQKQADEAKRQERDDTLTVRRHNDLVKPTVWAGILLALGSVAAGIYFIGIGREAIGSSLLTGVFGALFGFLGGLGTAKHLRR